MALGNVFAVVLIIGLSICLAFPFVWPILASKSKTKHAKTKTGVNVPQNDNIQRSRPFFYFNRSEISVRIARICRQTAAQYVRSGPTWSCVFTFVMSCAVLYTAARRLCSNVVGSCRSRRKGFLMFRHRETRTVLSYKTFNGLRCSQVSLWRNLCIYLTRISILFIV